MATNPILYNNNIQVFNEAQFVRSYCAEITFINNGNTVLILNSSLRMVPTQSISFDGKQNEEDTSVYNITFDATGVVIPVSACVVIRKFYNK
jgi:hypothetical protein